MQAGFRKFCCFLYLWDSRAVSQHYKQKDWGSRSTFVPGEHSVKENPLVDMNKVLLPPLHIKLGLMKNFVKALHKNGAAFQHLSTVFPGVGPQIWEVLKHTDFEELLNLKELRAWEAFKSVCSGFLGNTRVPDYQACIEKLLKSYKDMRCWMSLKIHFLHSHLNFFPPTYTQIYIRFGSEGFERYSRPNLYQIWRWRFEYECTPKSIPDLATKIRVRTHTQIYTRFGDEDSSTNAHQNLYQIWRRKICKMNSHPIYKIGWMM